MSEPSPRPPDVELLEVHRLRLVLTWARTTYRFHALRRHAARELVEETGIDVPLGDLPLWLVLRGECGDLGVLFLAPRRPASPLRERFDALVSSETALGRDPELDRIALVRSRADLAALGGPWADYLEPIIRRYAAPTAIAPRSVAPGRERLGSHRGGDVGFGVEDAQEQAE